LLLDFFLCLLGNLGFRLRNSFLVFLIFLVLFLKIFFILGILDLAQHLILSQICIWELLCVEETRLVAEGMFNVRVTGVTPIREVSKAENNRMSMSWVVRLVCQHV